MENSRRVSRDRALIQVTDAAGPRLHLGQTSYRVGPARHQRSNLKRQSVVWAGWGPGYWLPLHIITINRAAGSTPLGCRWTLGPLETWRGVITVMPEPFSFPLTRIITAQDPDRAGQGTSTSPDRAPGCGLGDSCGPSTWLASTSRDIEWGGQHGYTCRRSQSPRHLRWDPCSRPEALPSRCRSLNIRVPQSWWPPRSAWSGDVELRVRLGLPSPLPAIVTGVGSAGRPRI